MREDAGRMFKKLFKGNQEKPESMKSEQKPPASEKLKLLQKPKGHENYKDEDIDKCPYY